VIVPPGSTIGIIGGGQLGRLLAVAAAQLGYHCHIYAPDDAPPAAEVARFFTRGAYDDDAALARFAASVSVVTYEFENIPVAPLAAIAGTAPLFPPREALEIAQDRLREKEFILSLGGKPAPFLPVDSREDLKAAVGKLGAPAILKTRRMGYDGKGQARLRTPDDIDDAYEALNGAPAVLEGFVTFDAEFSILLCRGQDDEILLWEAPRNTHVHGILDRSEVPLAPAYTDAAAEAGALARKVASALDYVGVLALEFFATAEGPVFNEMAPRVHNSGHWTIEGATTSQFENHIRATCGLPLGATALRAPRVEMTNLIGPDANAWRDILSDPAARLHLYGKGEGRAGRKMGHVTRLIG
jgi:5-(carboxyamino)imidazole ribonucleotide synthase